MVKDKIEKNKPKKIQSKEKYLEDVIKKQDKGKKKGLDQMGPP